MKVFWSWQNDSDSKTNRQFIRDALAKAVEEAGEALGLEDAERPELDHDTKDTPGMTEITSTILRKISESAVFVADLTPIGEAVSGKALPNPNVLIELGWALSELGPDRIIAILNTHAATPDDLPFDIRHRRALTYELAPDADKPERRIVRAKLTSDLAEAITANLRQYSEEQAAAAEFRSVPAKEGDPSIWASHTGTLEYINTMERNGSVSSPDGPRAFLRVIPFGWKEGIPQIAHIQDAEQGEEVCPVAEVTSHGDFGPCEEGFVRFWFTGDNESRNVSMWFDETGEFWIIHGSAVVKWKPNKSMLLVGSVLRGWRQNLRSAMKVLDRFGAFPARKIEAGLVGIKGTMWPPDMLSFSAPARKDRTIIASQQTDWSDQAQLIFLTDAYNKIRDNFSFPRAEQSDLKNIVDS